MIHFIWSSKIDKLSNIAQRYIELKVQRKTRQHFTQSAGGHGYLYEEQKRTWSWKDTQGTSKELVLVYFLIYLVRHTSVRVTIIFKKCKYISCSPLCETCFTMKTIILFRDILMKNWITHQVSLLKDAKSEYFCKLVLPIIQAIDNVCLTQLFLSSFFLWR